MVDAPLAMPGPQPQGIQPATPSQPASGSPVAAPAATAARPPTGAELLAQAREERRQILEMAGELLQAETRRSEAINELATALAKAQAEILPAGKTSVNPFYKSKYADLAAVQNTCREPLAKNGLSYVQLVSGKGQVAVITTLLMHTSGQWIESRFAMIAKEDTPQAFGGAVTYGRRYGLSAMVGVATEDDDGQAASEDKPGDAKVSRGTSELQQQGGGSSEVVRQPVAPTLPAAAPPVVGGAPAPVARPVPAPPVAGGSPAPPGVKPATVVGPPPVAKPPQKAPGS